ncbi:MAG: hypothetical protein KatS3mg057_2744 [Herpetosiphonaceae bacterium]|nr:MAG: hypothetical protein KatS3mg057_2744 [Herpetosiphonaceae bacterium]
MQAKLLFSGHGLRTFALVFDKGDSFLNLLQDFAREQGITGASFTAIGAFSSITLGYFDREKMDYRKIPVNEQVEVLSLLGNIATKGQDAINAHAHIVVGKADGTALGGHILEARVWPTLELVLEETPAYLRRHSDEETGLALIDLGTERSRTAL